jgi:hypothetical protein
VIEALVDERDPKEEVRERDRMRALLAFFPGGGPALRLRATFRSPALRAGFCHGDPPFSPAAAYAEKVSGLLTSPWDPVTGVIQKMNHRNVDFAIRALTVSWQLWEL